MKIINEANGAHKTLFKFADEVLEGVEKPIAVVMGIAYGGEVEEIAKRWKGKGKIYGFDTFEDLHPTHLFKGDKTQEFEANCMSHWYTNPKYGVEKLKYDYQRATLDAQGLDNAILVKGEVHLDSCKDIPYINLAFLDMDILESMVVGYEAVIDKLVKGAYLLLHDVYPSDHIPRLYEWAQYLVETDDRIQRIGKDDQRYLMVFKKL